MMHVKYFTGLLITCLAFSCTQFVSAQWTKSNGATLPAGVVTSMAALNGSIYAVSNSILYQSDDNGATWNAIPATIFDSIYNPHSSVNEVFVNGSNVYIATNAAVIMNDGTGWTNITEGWNFSSENISFVIANGSTVIACVNSGSGQNGSSTFFVSTDLGQTWPTYAPNPEPSAATSLTSLGQNYYCSSSYGVLESTDGGFTWGPQSDNGLKNPLTNNIYPVQSVFASGNNLLAGTSNDSGVFISSNGAVNWTSACTGMPKLTTGGWRTVLSFAGSSPYILAGTQGGGLYKTTNNGTQWYSLNTGLSDVNVYSIAVSGATVFIGTETGVWQRPATQLSSVEQTEIEMPAGFALFQNYPNPFNDQTSLSFTVGDQNYFGKEISLELVSSVGNIVQEIYHGVADASPHVVNVNGANLPSGAYYAILRCNGTEAQTTLVVRH